ncbi:MAG: ribonuclease E activity regulator RraA [Pseudomonadota bacterium]
MRFTTPDLCDAHPDAVRVLAPLFSNYGAHATFGGSVVTVKCFEDNSLVKSQAQLPGDGRVLVVDGGASNRRALLGDQIAQKLADNGWAGIVIYGSVRDVEMLAQTPLGIQALGAIPVKTDKRGIGDLDVPISFASVTIRPGDYIYADANGIVVSQIALV